MQVIEFTAKLWAGTEGAWTFATTPKEASERLGARGRVPIRGTINGFPFSTSALPDGNGHHTIPVNKTMRRFAQVEAGQEARFVIGPDSDEVHMDVPTPLARALAKTPTAKRQWDDITPKARREWIVWIASAKQEATRLRRVDSAIKRLALGKRRASD
jgi:hypothetical protein